ncbi:MAG: efflux RND transporter permease subunit [Candidatus Dadabacteria bacterium]|nr:efflux RND transporter permease subunit [Candidatus Dadabacteria bacterium]
MVEKTIEYFSRKRFIVFIIVGFLTVWGIWALKRVPLDAIPDLSDVQVIVFTDWPGRSPDLVEDQITYPIVTTLLSAPKVTSVRGTSMFGFSFVYVLFEDGTNIYWARTRVLEYMSGIRGRLPEGVTPVIGPDATGVGWVFQYALVDETGRHNLAELRSFNDWYLRYWLRSVPGVAEVESIGGFQKQYQVNIDPNKLLAYNIPLTKIIQSIRMSNNDVGGRVVEATGREYAVRGRGYIKSVGDIENIVVAMDGRGTGTPVFIKDIADVSLGPDIRRGIAELDGKGEVLGGVVVMRYGENALNVIKRVKEKLKEVEPAFPEGVKLVVTYDRSNLILRAIDTLKRTLIEESIIVSLVCILFLFHFRSALVIIFTLPFAILFSFIPMYYMKLTSNIMSLGGIAIAIGAMVDAAIVLVENVHKRLEHWQEEGGIGDRLKIMIDASKEVGKPIFFALLVIVVSFIPVFTLEAQEGRLFKPLAYTKTFGMFFAALLSITLTPALITILIRGKIASEKKNPINRFLIRVYEPLVRLVVRWKKTTIGVALFIFLVTIPLFFKLGSEFMPPLNEGSIMYMPITPPGISITEAGRLLQIQDKIIRQFPEVETVFGKVGRAETPTDPAPLSMVENTITLKPEDEWRKIPQKRWYSSWAPEFIKKILRPIWPDHKRMSWDELTAEMNSMLKFPGVTNIWTMPIRNRTDMLTTGIRTPVGIKIYGKDLRVIEEIGEQIEAALRDVPGTISVYAERVTGGYYLDFNIRREEVARYGLTVGDVEDIIETAIGGNTVTQTVEGPERYQVNVRYARELRDDVEKLKRALVPTPMGAQIPLEQLANIKTLTGPSEIRNEDGTKAAYVFIDTRESDIGGYVEEAKKAVKEKVNLPQGYYISWSGQYEFLLRVREKLKLVIPITLLIIFVLLYLNFGSVIETLIVILSVPFALVGSVWLMHFLGYNMSIAVWVGIIAVAGLAAQTGVVMIIYLDNAYKKRVKEGKMSNWNDLALAIDEGAVQRVRPKMMTVMTMILGLLPLLWSHGTGADVMKRIAAPMIGGLVTSTILTLLIIPVIYAIWKGRSLQTKEK